MISPDGSFLINDKSPGVTLTATRVGPGIYQVVIGGMGSGCPLPIANAFADTYVWLNAGGCGVGELTTTLNTGDGLDHFIAFSAVGSAASPAATALNEAVVSRAATAAGPQAVELPGSGD